MSDFSSLPPDSTPPNPTEPPSAAGPASGQPEQGSPAQAASEWVGTESSPLAAPTRDECTLGMLAHVLQIVSWFIAPAIILLVRRDSRFVRYHALQALFFQLLVVFVWAATLIAICAGFFVALARHPGAVGPAVIGAPILFFVVFWGGGALGWLLNLVLGIVYGLLANNGEWAGYPGIKYLAAKVAGVELPRYALVARKRNVEKTFTNTGPLWCMASG